MKVISREIFQAFVSSVRAEGSIPLLVYLPSEIEESDQVGYDPPSAQILRAAGLEYIDLTECISRVPVADRRMPRGHLSPKGNEAVASCLLEVVKEQFRKG
jgi:hypothetical protein